MGTSNLSIRLRLPSELAVTSLVPAAAARVHPHLKVCLASNDVPWLEIALLGPDSGLRSALVGGWTYHSLGLFDIVAHGKELVESLILTVAENP